MNIFPHIFIHCSDSNFGHAMMINDWHVQRKFKMIGYHRVIQNGYPSSSWFKEDIKISYLEGSIEIGRIIDSDNKLEIWEMGAHVKHFNKNSFGICMIGKNDFSNKVLNSTLAVVAYHMEQLNIQIEHVLGHYEKDTSKTCPNIDMVEFRQMLMDNKQYGIKTIFVPKVKPEIRKELSWKKILKFIFRKR